MDLKLIGGKINDSFKSLTKREIILIAVIVVLVIVAIFLAARSGGPSQSETAYQNSGSPSSGQSATWQPLTGKISVPDVNSPKSDIANPNSVVAAAPVGAAKSRSFSITISNNQFAPSQLAVYQGDNVIISFAAKDNNYDVYQPDYGLKQIIPKSGAASIMFSAVAAGKFTFYCQSCGGPAKGPVGYIYVSPK